MSTFSRLLAACSALAAAFVLLATASVASGYPPSQFREWLFLLPMFTPLLTALLAVVLFFLRTNSGILFSWLWGVFACAELLLVHQALRLALQYEAITSDGTAYWTLLSLPALYGGIATIVLGGILALVTAFRAPRIPPRGTEPTGL